MGTRAGSVAKCSDLGYGALKAWFQPGRKSCVCPRHNPTPVDNPCCDPCAIEPAVSVDWSKRCRHVKNYCFRRHGEDCCCHACVACRKEDDDFHCHLMQGQPHDYGCECSQCSKCRGGKPSRMFQLARAADTRPKECKCGACVEDRERRKSDEHQVLELEKKVAQLGERCYCLLHHPRDCQCEQCVECRVDLAKDEVREKIAAKRHRELMAVLSKQEGLHGAECECLQCMALRQRLEMTMCHEHLDMCRCMNQLGRACKWCKTCDECMRLTRTQTIPKAEDRW